MEKIILGLSFGFNASAALVSNERGVIAAISQERLNGQKNTKEIPIEAAVRCCSVTGEYVIDKIAYSHYQKLSVNELHKYASGKVKSKNMFEVKDNSEQSAEKLLIEMIKNEGIILKEDFIERVEHHIAHAYSPIGVYGFQEGSKIIITSDGFGDGISARMMLLDKLGEHLISEVPLRGSMALLYQFVTGALGYKMHQHEGKLTGLAAYGEPRYINTFENLFNKVDTGNGYEVDPYGIELTAEDEAAIRKSTIEDFEGFLKYKYSVFRMIEFLKTNGAEDKDIAASLQEFVERVTCTWILDSLKKFNLYEKAGKKVCMLSGGLFANVKLNQKIKDMCLFREILVSPCMGDEGNAIGSAVKVLMREEKSYKVEESNVYYGTDIFRDLAKVVRYLNDNGYKGKYASFGSKGELIEKIATCLAEKKIVCLCRGRMEFGPRALCHRSILYDCTDVTTNDWLNKKLGRTEFMPFAPVLRKENADLFYDYERAKKTCEFMTMTLNCKQEFVQNYPAACHVDNTARPQFVTDKSDEFMYNVLKRYENMSGKKVLINTSFNLHNYPIIENPVVAIESWEKSETDVLVIGNIVISK